MAIWTKKVRMTFVSDGTFTQNLRMKDDDIYNKKYSICSV